VSVNIIVRPRTTLLAYIFWHILLILSYIIFLLDTSVFYVSIDFENGSLSYSVHKPVLRG